MCAVPAGATLTINGDVVITGHYAVLLSEFAPAHVTINGDIRVMHGGLLALGTLNEGSGCAPASTATSVVNGDITAENGLSVKLDCSVVNGDVMSTGGGQGGFSTDCITSPDALNFVVKDNVINGNLSVRGWQGCWIGAIRNVVSGSVTLRNNRGADPDAMEVLTNIIGRNLGCWHNSPHPQVGDALGPTPPPPPYNTVAGRQLGQCKGL